MLVKIVIGVGVLVIALIVAVRLGLTVIDVQPKLLGTEAGQLKPCPGTPNCVSSTSKVTGEHVDAIDYRGTQQQALRRLLQVITSMPNGAVKTQTDNYVHAEFTSRLFGFIDDVEFLFDSDGAQIHLRSASRIGRSDLGANRKRVDLMREGFNKYRDTDDQ